MMNTFHKYAVILAGCVMGLSACSSDEDSSTSGGKAVIDQPQVLVSEVTTSGFTLRWDAVANAGAYVYTFNGGEATEISERQIAFHDLERQKEYVVAVKALPKFADEYAESPYTYVHVITDDLEQLPQPEITLGCAYASKTVISWTESPEAAAYEYTLGDDGANHHPFGAGEGPRLHLYGAGDDLRCNALHQLRACRARLYHLDGGYSDAAHRSYAGDLRRRGVPDLRHERGDLFL